MEKVFELNCDKLPESSLIKVLSQIYFDAKETLKCLSKYLYIMFIYNFST